MTVIRGQSQPAGLFDPSGAFQQKPALISTTPYVLSWSTAADGVSRIVG